jgi:peroxiredoxin Q/BCP
VIKVGDPAPDFTAAATDGRTIQLSKLRGQTVVLYFFPRAFSPGCTIEALTFRDQHADFAGKGAQVIGVSTDAFDRQCRFANQHKLPFPLVGDATKTISRAYGVLSWFEILGDRRITVVIDPTGRVRAVIGGSAKLHADKAKKELL